MHMQASISKSMFSGSDFVSISKVARRPVSLQGTVVSVGLWVDGEVRVLEWIACRAGLRPLRSDWT